LFSTPEGAHSLEEMWENTEESGSRRARYHLAMMRTDYLVNADPSDDEIDRALLRNVCRCGTYQRIRKAIHRAAQEG